MLVCAFYLFCFFRKRDWRIQLKIATDDILVAVHTPRLGFVWLTASFHEVLQISSTIPFWECKFATCIA